VNNLVITNASINISVCAGAAAIGSGHADDNGRSIVRNLPVLNQAINIAAAVYGSRATIGAGRANQEGISAVDNMLIQNGIVDIVARSGSTGIESGQDVAVVINGASITLTNCLMHVATDTARVFSSAPATRGTVDLAFLYRDQANESMEPIGHRGAIEMGDVRFSAAIVWDVVLSSGRSLKSLAVNSAAVRRIFLTIEAARNYSAFLKGSGRLVDRRGGGMFAVGAGPLFIDELHVAAPPHWRSQNRTATVTCTLSEAA
jgi:hypothetical protein